MTTLEVGGERTRGHGLPLGILEEQASSLGIPLLARPTSWEGYREVFLLAVEELKGEGVEVGVFGDIDLEEHREWIEEVCLQAGVTPHLPLWGEKRKELLGEFIESGFEARVVVVKDGVLDSGFLGRKLDVGLLEELAEAGIDAAGEAGEYHTVVTDGPIFSSPVDVRIEGRVFRDGCWMLDVVPGGDDGWNT